MHYRGGNSEQLLLRVLNNKYISYKLLTSLRCGSTCFSELLPSCSFYSLVTHSFAKTVNYDPTHTNRNTPIVRCFSRR